MRLLRGSRGQRDNHSATPARTIGVPFLSKNVFSVSWFGFFVCFWCLFFGLFFLEWACFDCWLRLVLSWFVWKSPLGMVGGLGEKLLFGGFAERLLA